MSDADAHNIAAAAASSLSGHRCAWAKQLRIMAEELDPMPFALRTDKGAPVTYEEIDLMIKAAWHRLKSIDEKLDHLIERHEARDDG